MRLSPNELEIMEILWPAGTGLTRKEIVAACEDKSWKSSSIYILLNSMIEKGAVTVAGVKLEGKHYSRTFAATLSKDEYQKQEFLAQPFVKSKPLCGIMSTLIEEKGLTQQDVYELRQLLEDKEEGL